MSNLITQLTAKLEKLGEEIDTQKVGVYRLQREMQEKKRELRSLLNEWYNEKKKSLPNEQKYNAMANELLEGTPISIGELMDGLKSALNCDDIDYIVSLTRQDNYPYYREGEEQRKFDYYKMWQSNNNDDRFTITTAKDSISWLKKDVASKKFREEYFLDHSERSIRLDIYSGDKTLGYINLPLNSKYTFNDGSTMTDHIETDGEKCNCYSNAFDPFRFGYIMQTIYLAVKYYLPKDRMNCLDGMMITIPDITSKDILISPDFDNRKRNHKPMQYEDVKLLIRAMSTTLSARGEKTDNID